LRDVLPSLPPPVAVAVVLYFASTGIGSLLGFVVRAFARSLIWGRLAVISNHNIVYDIIDRDIHPERTFASACD
jgi:hypothetical protein